jgi:hypothetical protein
VKTKVERNSLSRKGLPLWLCGSLLYCWNFNTIFFRLGFYSSVWQTLKLLVLTLWECTHVYWEEEAWGFSGVGWWNDCWAGNQTGLQFPSLIHEDKEKRRNLPEGILHKSSHLSEPFPYVFKKGIYCLASMRTWVQNTVLPHIHTHAKKKGV